MIQHGLVDVTDSYKLAFPIMPKFVPQRLATLGSSLWLYPYNNLNQIQSENDIPQLSVVSTVTIGNPFDGPYGKSVQVIPYSFPEIGPSELLKTDIA